MKNESMGRMKYAVGVILLVEQIVGMFSAGDDELPESEHEIMITHYDTMNTWYGTMTPPRDYLTRGVDQVMLPLYDATHYFIQSALSPPPLLRLNATFDLGTWERVGDAFYADWVGWADHYLNYVLCMTSAAVYVLFLATCATATCCCRLRGRCGSYNAMDAKHAKCKRRTCGVFLVVVNLFLLLGVIAAFIANQLIWEQTVTSGMTQKFQRSLHLAREYQNTTTLAYQNLDVEADNGYNNAKLQLSEIPQQTVDDIDKIYNVTAILDDLETQSKLLEDIIAPIEAAANLTAQLTKFETDFQIDLIDIQDNLRQDLGSCSSSVCQNVTDTSDSITIQTNFSSLPDITYAAEIFMNITTGNTTIYHQINASKASYGTLFDQIEQQTVNETDRLLLSTAAMYGNLKFFLNYTIDDVLLRFDLDGAIRDFEDNARAEIANDGDVRYFCCLALCLLALMIVVFGFVALCFGICGERAGDDSGFCNRARGANVLKLAMLFIVIFGIVFMGAVTFFFILGTIAHNDVCRPLTEPHEAPLDTVQALDYALSRRLDLQTSFQSFLQLCNLNQTLYAAVQIELLGSEYNITKILNLDKYNIIEDLNAIEARNYTVEIVILSTDLEGDLSSIETAFSAMELEKYQEELSKPVTNLDLLEFAMYLEELGNMYNGTNDTLSDIFFDFASEYENLHQTYVVAIETSSELLKTELEPIIKVDSSFNTTRFSDELSDVEAAINSGQDVNDKIHRLAYDLTQEYQDFSTQNTKQIELEIGPTASLFEAYQESSVAFCVMFLYPFNAFWLSIGWCLMWYLPLLVVYLCLIDVYNKTKQYSEQSFRGVHRSSFNRYCPRNYKGKRGKSKHSNIAGIHLDHDPGCTADDEDIDMSHYGRTATTSFHGNDAFGYQGRTIDDDALEYFGNANLRIVARNRGISDGFLPTEAHRQTTLSTTSRSNESTEQCNTQSTTQSANSVQRQQQQLVQNNRQVPTQSIHSTQSSQKSESSDEDNKSSSKSTLERVSHSNTYPVRDRPIQLETVAIETTNPVSKTYDNAPSASKSPARQAIPTAFMAGAANYAYDHGSDSNEEFVDEDYVLRMRRTSQRLSRERESKKKRRQAKPAEQAKVQPWYVEADERYKKAVSKHAQSNIYRQHEVQGITQDNSQNNRQDAGAVIKQRKTVYEPNPDVQIPSPGTFTDHNHHPPESDQPNREILIQYPPDTSNGDRYDPEACGGSVHNVKPSEIKRRLIYPDPLRVWQPPPPPPVEDEGFNYPPVSMLASSPARNYGRPAAAVQPYSYSPQRSPPTEPTPAQAFSYLLGQKPSDLSEEYAQPSGQGQGQGHSQGQDQPPPYNAYKYSMKYNTPEAEISSSPARNSDNPVSCNPQNSGYQGNNNTGAGSYPPGRDYARQTDHPNPGYLNAAYF